MPDCPDPFHEGDSDGIPYEIPGLGGWSGTGYQCPTCGFRTVEVSTYVPTEKPCAQCGAAFLGVPDEPDEICVDCILENVNEYIASQR